MKEHGEQKQREAGEGLAVLANWIVRICGTAIFLFLTWYSFRYTQYMNPGGEEIPLNVWDSMSRNLLVLLFAGAFLVFLAQVEKRFSQQVKNRIKQAALALTLLWIGGWSFWWITGADRLPTGDQAFVYGGASYFLEGNYEFLAQGGYFGMYPHQLALTALMELLFVFVGTYNYFAFQVICAFLAVGIVFLGYRIVEEIADQMSVLVFYCAAMLGCLPLIFYTSWVYGDIPSIFFSLLTAWALLRYGKKSHWGYLTLCVFSLTMGILVRKNSLILLIAFCLVSLVWAVYRKDRKILMAAALSVLLPWLLYMGIYKMYELRSGYEHSKGLPVLSWVSMGLQENNGRYGWYFDYPRRIYYENDCDRDITEEIVKQDIRERLGVFRADASYAWTFFREKLLSQWNEPLYQSLYFNTEYVEGFEPPADSLTAKLGGEYFVKVLWVCDRLQFVVYFGMLLYFVLAVRPKSNLLQHLLAVMMIGGFLFSIFWEAKARYVLPYYVTMFSFSAVGYWQLMEQIFGMIRGRGRKDKDNIIKFRKAA